MENKKIKRYWFFRSFFISTVILGLILTFIFGAAHCYSVMEHTLYGEDKKAVEIKDGEFFVLGERVEGL